MLVDGMLPRAGTWLLNGGSKSPFGNDNKRGDDDNVYPGIKIVTRI